MNKLITNQPKQITQTIFTDIDSKDSLIREISSKSGFTLSDTRLFLDTLISIFEELMMFRLELKVNGWLQLTHTLISKRIGSRPTKGKKGFSEKIELPESTRSNLKISLNMRRLSKSELPTISEEDV